MAVTKNWTDTWLDGSVDTGDKIDDRVNEMSSAIHERMINGGHSWQDGTNATDGIHMVSPDNYRPNEWNVFKSDRIDQVLTCTDDEVRLLEDTYIEGTLHAAGNATFDFDLAVGGTITQDGNKVLDRSSKRIIVLSDSGTGTGVTDTQSRETQRHIHVVPYDATIVAFTAMCYEGTTNTVKLQTRPTATSSDSIKLTGAWSDEISHTVASGYEGVYKTGLSISITAGTALRVVIDGSKTWETHVYLEVDW